MDLGEKHEKHQSLTLLEKLRWEGRVCAKEDTHQDWSKSTQSLQHG